MTGSRRVVFVSMVVVALGTAAALGLLYLDPARAAVGPLPAAGLVLPANARFLVGMDIKRMTASPLYQRYMKNSERSARPEVLKSLEEKTGLNPERDVDEIVITGEGGSDTALALALGHFDRAKLAQAIEAEKQQHKVSWKDQQGTTVYLFDEGGKGTVGLAFLDDHSLVLGTQRALETTISNHNQGSPGLRSNAALMGLLERVKPGSTFWMVGDQTLLANLPKTLPNPVASGGGEGASSLNLPTLRNLIGTGDLDPLVALAITGETTDEAAAKNLADMLRGLLGFLSLQAAQKPELKELAQAISVTTEASRVQVNARFSYELLDALKAQKQAPPSITSK